MSNLIPSTNRKNVINKAFLKTLLFSLVIFQSLFFNKSLLANELYLNNQLQLFHKDKLSSPFSTSVFIWPVIQEIINLPENDLKVQKIYEHTKQYTDENNSIQVTLQIFLHQKENSSYFSQQVLLSKDQVDIAFCTSYFDKSNQGLVPGACVGYFAPFYWGVAIYKK